MPFRISLPEWRLWAALTAIGLFLPVGCARSPAPAEAAPPLASASPPPSLLPAVPPPATAPGPREEGLRYGRDLTRFETGILVGAWRCATCHSRLIDRQGNDMSITDHWRSTMMANAAKDPFWQAKVQSETARHPGLKKVIEEKCVSCHMPMAWRLAAPASSPSAGKEGIFASFLTEDSPLHEPALDGVSCSLCHQIQDENLGRKESFSGRFSIDRERARPDRRIFGPYPEPVQWPMRTSIGFNPEFGPHTNDSALCATCHTLYTPYVDGKGRVAGEFPEQMVYLEWLHSAFAEPPGRRHGIGEPAAGVRLCQECHMPHSEGGGVLIARPAPPETQPKDHFSRHHFVGGNAFMLALLQDELHPLGLTASSAHLAATRERTVRQLQERTAQLTIAELQQEADALRLTLRVENLVGHKFPTGFPSRRAWLHVTVADAAGKTLFESGRPAADGSIEGDDANRPGGWEPHHHLIAEPGQVQIYEAVMQDTEGRITYTLLRGSGYIKDNRLLPRGFAKETAAADIAVHGRAAVDADFAGGSDLVRYRIPLAGRSGPFTVQAALLYTPISSAFLADLRQEEELALVGRFVRSYDRADKTPVTVATAAATIR